jgi:hypothetical protein
MARVTRRCPRGKILRSAYSRKSRNRKVVHVAAACIKDVGNPGKGLPSGEPGIGPLRHNDLKQFGYGKVTSMSAETRRIALAKAIKAYNPLSIFRKLNAIYVYTRNTAPASSKIFKADRDWVKSHYM